MTEVSGLERVRGQHAYLLAGSECRFMSPTCISFFVFLRILTDGLLLFSLNRRSAAAIRFSISSPAWCSLIRAYRSSGGEAPAEGRAEVEATAEVEVEAIAEATAEGPADGPAEVEATAEGPADGPAEEPAEATAEGAEVEGTADGSFTTTTRRGCKKNNV